MKGNTPNTLRVSYIRYACIMLCGIALLFSYTSKASTARQIIDSMKREFANARNQQNKNRIALSISDHYNEFFYKGDSSLYFANYVLTHPDKKLKALQDAEAYFNTARAWYYLHQPERSLTFLDTAYQLSRSSGNTYIEYRCLYFKSVMFGEINEPDSALKFLQSALAVNTKSKNYFDMAGILNDLGNYYFERKDYTKAFNYNYQSYKIWKNIGEFYTPGILSDLGNCLYYTGNYDSALYFYNLSYNVNKKVKNVLGLGYSLNNIGLVYQKKKDYDKALEYYYASLKYYEEDENRKGRANVLDNICKTYIAKKKYPIALKEIERALPLALLSRDRSIIYGVYKDFVDVYEGQGNYPQAFKYQKILTDYRDSIYGASKAIADAALQSHISIMQKDAENKVLRSEKAVEDEQFSENKRLSIIISIFLLITMAALAILLWNVRQRSKAMLQLKEQNKIIEEKNAELAILNSELSKKTEALENLNKFKDKLFSIISHDFRSPLVSLNSFLALLLEVDFPKEAIKELSEEMIDRVNLTLNFVDNLIEWAQSQILDTKKVFDRFQAGQVVEEMLELYGHQAHTKGVEMVNEVPVDLMLSTNAGMMKMVLRNLISNAIKFSSSGDKVFIRARKGPGNIIFTVEDTGRGITPETMKELFSGLIQSKPGTASEKGNGMGLILCREFLEKYGGKIWVDSQEGNGSSFSFSIPYKETLILQNI